MLLGTQLELCENTLKTTKIQKIRFTLVVIDILVICALASALLPVDFCLINGPYSSYRFGSPWDLLFLFSTMFENSRKHFCLSFFMFPSFKMANSSKEIGLISSHNFKTFALTHPFLCVNWYPLCTYQSMVNKKSCHPYMVFCPLQLSCIHYIFWPRRGIKKMTCLIAFATYSINSFYSFVPIVCNLLGSMM